MNKHQEPTKNSVWRHWHHDVPNDRMAHLVRDTSRLLARSLQARLTNYDVSFGHWAFLRILWVKDGITQAKLSEEAGLMVPTTFAALKAMEKKGYIYRRKKADNKQKVFIYLTPEGKALKNVLTPLGEEVNSLALDGLSSEHKDIVRAALLHMIENLAEDPIFNE
ncbi:MarR family winged helix-turn-helix transcriptional regulator [Saccharospirillum sp.]|uniref:MarR family winged helix-turn-helix transcriptional regulator n=1 Tax=Saccharospirillum sp. TaxID=2033801 RepID=UPI0034A066D2